MRSLILAACFVLLIALLPACDRPRYSQKTPDDVLASARLMVERGEADRLAALLYAENDQTRRLYNSLGRLFRSLQDLGVQINARFPDEVREMKAKAEASGGKGAASILNQIGRSRRSRGGQPGRAQQDLMTDLIRSIFADPYAFLREQSGRLTTVAVNDDTAAVLWDGKPIPPLGLAMRRAAVADGYAWFIVPPTNIPVVSRFLPKSDAQFKIWGSLFRTLDNAVVELAQDVKAGSITSIDDVARKAGEKLFIPAAMTFYAIGKAAETPREANREEKLPAPPG